MKKALLILLLGATLQLHAQLVEDFEGFGLATDEYLNDAGMAGGFQVGSIFLPNSYDPSINYWTGWAISASTDDFTPGFMNQFGAITGSGFDGSATYAITFAANGSSMELTNGNYFPGMYVTNSTYAYFSMLEGDGFAKKFGGEDGNDPDFFKLTVRAYYSGQLMTDSVEFYLADYRFADNSQDYILDEWSFLDLTSLWPVDSLLFSLSSSDVGQFGMNTPGYFCVDNVNTNVLIATQQRLPEGTFSFFPNPAVETLTVDWKENTAAELSLRSMDGRLVLQGSLAAGRNQFNVAHLTAGSFLLEIQSEGRSAGKVVLKK